MAARRKLSATETVYFNGKRWVLSEPQPWGFKVTALNLGQHATKAEATKRALEVLSS